MNPADFAKIEEGHFIHLGNRADGYPCNSSVTMAHEQGFDEPENRGMWRCLGCGHWWARMPGLTEEGLNALARIKR